MTEYVEFHARSAFSFLEGASLPENLVAACENLDSSVALSERFAQAGAAAGSKVALNVTRLTPTITLAWSYVGA